MDELNQELLEEFGNTNLTNNFIFCKVMQNMERHGLVCKRNKQNTKANKNFIFSIKHIRKYL